MIRLKVEALGLMKTLQHLHSKIQNLEHGSNASASSKHPKSSNLVGLILEASLEVT